MLLRGAARVKFLDLGWRGATCGAWGAGAVIAFIGVFLPWVDMYVALRREPYTFSGAAEVPGTTVWILAVVALGALLLLLTAKPPEAVPCLVAFGSAVAIVMIGIINVQDIGALQPFRNPDIEDSDGFYRIGTGVRLVLAGGIMSCAGSLAYPLLGLWRHYRGPEP